MATDRIIENLVSTMYPKSMRHLRQLLMDAESCAKSYGKKSIFGNDKFAPRMKKFNATIATCALSLSDDGIIKDPYDATSALRAIDSAMFMMSKAYTSWPLVFRFWADFYSSATDA